MKALWASCRRRQWRHALRGAALPRRRDDFMRASAGMIGSQRFEQPGPSQRTSPAASRRGQLSRSARPGEVSQSPSAKMGTTVNAERHRLAAVPIEPEEEDRCCKRRHRQHRVLEEAQPQHPSHRLAPTGGTPSSQPRTPPEERVAASSLSSSRRLAALQKQRLGCLGRRRARSRRPVVRLGRAAGALLLVSERRRRRVIARTAQVTSVADSDPEYEDPHQGRQSSPAPQEHRRGSGSPAPR